MDELNSVDELEAARQEKWVIFLVGVFVGFAFAVSLTIILGMIFVPVIAHP
jgi:hypothetical protein